MMLSEIAYKLIEGRMLYRGTSAGKFTPRSSGAIFFSPNKEYAMDYGDVVISTEQPTDIFDPRVPSNLEILANWIEDRIETLMDSDEYFDMPGSTKTFVRDASRLIKDRSNVQSVLSAMINLGIAEAGGFGNYKVGQIEKIFMDDHGISAMYMIESGNTTDRPDSEWSVAFSKMPDYKIVEMNESLGLQRANFRRNSRRR